MAKDVLKRVYTVMDRARAALIVIIFAFIVVIGAVQIFMRYTPGLTPMSWIFEIMRYTNIWLVLLASSIGVKHGSHLKMDYFAHKIFKGKSASVLKLITSAAIVVSLCILIYFGAIRTLDNVRTKIQTLPISIAWFYAAIPAGGVIILFEYILVFLFGKHPFAPVDTSDEAAEIL